MNYPRVLVVSNQCFSQATSNGRTLGLLFKGWPKDRLAQFCLSLANADTEICTNYFAVSDRAAMKAFVSLGILKPTVERVPTPTTSAATTDSTQRIAKTAAAMLLRNIVWQSRLWQSRSFKAWLKDFAPQIVLLQSGDTAFMADLAYQIAKKFDAKLVVFNTEGYIFFDHNYMRHHWTDAIAFPWFKAAYRRSFMRMFRHSDLSIYLNETLDRDYQELLPHRSVVIYNSSDLTFTPATAPACPPRFAYLGNLGIKRPEALAEFAGVLQAVRPDCHLDVYGRVPAQYQHLMENTPGLVYHGLVSYDRVKEVIAESDFLVHVEKDDPILAKELKYAFSTKIADSICSGRNFIVYAPAHLACSQYVEDTGAAWLASSKGELADVLRAALSDEAQRRRVLAHAEATAKANHNADRNRERFTSNLCTLCPHR